MPHPPSTDYTATSDATIDTIDFMYQMLTSCTESPMHSAAVLSGLYVKLWLRGAAPDADLEAMLTSLCETIRFNVELNQATQQ